MDAAGYFAGAIEAFDAGRAVTVDFDAAVLVVQSRMNHYGFDGRVDAAFVGNVAERNQTVQHIRIVFNQARGVEEHADLSVAHHAAAFAALAQNGGGNDVARLQFVNETLAQTVDQFGACGAHGFGNQRACQVRRMGDAGRMVLEGINVAQFRADAVCHHQTVGGCAVVVGSGETLQMQPSATTGCQYHGFGVNQYQRAFFQIVQNRADAAAVFVRQ